MNHGHVFPRADGTKADCGGQRHCAVCASEQMALDTVLENPGAIDLVLKHAAANHQPADFQTDEITVSGQQWTPAEARLIARSIPEQPQGGPAAGIGEQSDANRQTFQRELAHLINRHSLENGSDTPDFLLAVYLSSCLDGFDLVVKARDKWYGRSGLSAVIGDTIAAANKVP